jgi:hypothetical protein
MFGLKVRLVFIKGIILIKHKSYLIKLKNIYFLYEFLKKKKKTNHNCIPYTLQIFFQRQGYARLCLEGGVVGEGGGTCMMSFLWQTPLSFSYV